MAFRMVLYATEMSEQKISKATFLEYCNYCFFYPAITVGPITRPSAFIAGLRGPSVMTGNVIDSLLRVFIGGFKYYFLGPIVGRFSVTEFAIGYAAISAVQFLILGVGSLLHLYCNFSGLCDIAVGTANVLGLPFDENFFNPFSSRSVSQFWQRWHMTLSRFLRELMFLPLTRIYQSILGVRHLDFAVNLSIVSTFAVIGIWHGLKANYLVFGLLHGFAVVIENRGSQMLRMLFPNRKLESVVGARLGAVLPQLLTMGFVSISQLAFLLPIEKWSLVLKHLLCFF